MTTAMPATLVLLKRDPQSGAWEREGRTTFEDDEHGSAEDRARAHGETWVSEGSDQRREYRVLLARAPFDRERA